MLPLQQLPKGVDLDTVKKATRQPLEFSRKLTSTAGDVGEVKLLRDSARVNCAAAKQKMTPLNFTDWFGKPVSVTEPWVKAPAGNRRPTLQKDIRFGVLTELSESDSQKPKQSLFAELLSGSLGSRLNWAQFY